MRLLADSQCSLVAFKSVRPFIPTTLPGADEGTVKLLGEQRADPSSLSGLRGCHDAGHLGPDLKPQARAQR